MKNRLIKEYISIALILVLIFVIGIGYINFLDLQKLSLKHEKYKEEAFKIRHILSSLIYQKQKATLAIALSLSSNQEIVDDINDNSISNDYYKELVKKYNEHTLYKNIWIELIDSNNKVLYRSWSKLKDDMGRDYHKSKKPDVCITYNEYDLLIKAQIPFYKGYRYIGALEIFSHFNSLSKTLSKDSIKSIVIVDKKDSKTIKYPFTKIVLDGHYVSNIDVDERIIRYVKRNGVENYLNDDFKIENGYLIVSKRLQDINGKDIATYVMFKKLSSISTTSLDYQMFQWLVLGLIVLVSSMLMFLLFVFYRSVKLKRYYKRIIDSSTNVMIITNGTEIMDVNKLFFKYVKDYKNLREFKFDYDCVCDFFEEEDGYLKSDMDGLSWLEYILKHSDTYHKVKIKFGAEISYFSISASLISDEKHHYVVVFSDITDQENYKREIENLTITDALTGIYNRRYFDEKLSSEMIRATRYNHELSLIMFDIDYFKDVNDTHGHDVGDDVLKVYTSLISKYLRINDVFCRIGGEEFVIILPHATREAAFEIASKFREIVEDANLITPITMSFGVVEYKYEESADELYKRVDTALYKAKNSGRNKVVAM